MTHSVILQIVPVYIAAPDPFKDKIQRFFTCFDKQMDMINGVRNFKPEHPSYLTRKLIEKEGLDAEKQAKIDLGIEEPEKEAPKAEKKVEDPDKLNKGVNYGHGPVA